MVYFYLENTGIRAVLWPYLANKIFSLGAREKTCAACGYSATVRSPVGFSSAGHGQSLPAAPAPPGIIAGAAGSTCPPGLVAGVWSASSSARPSQPEIHVIDPLRVHFSLHGLGEYDACQA